MKIKTILIIFFGFLLFGEVYGDAPLTCSSLIGCTSSSAPLEVIGEFIAELIKYIAVIAVITVMISGIYYVISMGEEEKAKKAKKAIIWSIVGVILSISAWYIIHSINNLSI